ncbi:hypothetical protein [uncultured Parasphingopyxis sp.]|uniref:hypothetical protein n=1 Tax=uncultured Parasphingopyxis sp. TaxID=1547918 RepID=UPI0026187A42|nr:hypothetical protein [uncultured Parasphingopyxis sp.]
MANRFERFVRTGTRLLWLQLLLAAIAIGVTAWAVFAVADLKAERDALIAERDALAAGQDDADEVVETPPDIEAIDGPEDETVEPPDPRPSGPDPIEPGNGGSAGGPRVVNPNVRPVEPPPAIVQPDRDGGATTRPPEPETRPPREPSTPPESATGTQADPGTAPDPGTRVPLPTREQIESAVDRLRERGLPDIRLPRTQSRPAGTSTDSRQGDRETSEPQRRP